MMSPIFYRAYFFARYFLFVNPGTTLVTKKPLPKSTEEVI